MCCLSSAPCQLRFRSYVPTCSQKLECIYFSTGVGCGALVAVGTAEAGAGALGCSSLGTGLKGSSFNGPLVALMPAAGLEAGISGMSRDVVVAGAGASAGADGADKSVAGFAVASVEGV
jgi:hypothetical protein